MTTLVLASMLAALDLGQVAQTDPRGIGYLTQRPALLGAGTTQYVAEDFA